MIVLFFFSSFRFFRIPTGDISFSVLTRNRAKLPGVKPWLFYFLTATLRKSLNLLGFTAPFGNMKASTLGGWYKDEVT